MRTKGKLIRGKFGKVVPVESDDLLGRPISFDGVALAMNAPDSVAEDNSDHLVACWNAVESIGGDPERVGAMYEALTEIQESLQFVLDSDLEQDGAVHTYILKLMRFADSALEEL